MKDTTFPNQQAYQCTSDYATNIGDNLGNHAGTSVWLETITTNPLWYNAFSDTYWVASHALIYRNGFGQNWTSALYPIGDTSCSNPNVTPPQHQLWGTLLNGGVVDFQISDAYIQCY